MNEKVWLFGSSDDFTENTKWKSNFISFKISSDNRTQKYSNYKSGKKEKKKVLSTGSAQTNCCERSWMIGIIINFSVLYIVCTGVFYYLIEENSFDFLRFGFGLKQM